MPQLNVGLILTRRFTLCALGNFVDVLRLAADEGDRSRPILCAWKVLSPTMEPIASSSGIVVQPDEPLGDPARFDYLVVVGGLVDEVERLHTDTVRFLERAAAAGIPLVGVCTGTYVLHRAGLMDGYRACVSWFHHDDFLERFDGLKPVSDQIFVVDRDRLTCSGGVPSACVRSRQRSRRAISAAGLYVDSRAPWWGASRRLRARLSATRLPALRRACAALYDDELVSHGSWSAVWWRFMTDARLGPLARVVRHSRRE